jgi:hypothetical protein
VVGFQAQVKSLFLQALSLRRTRLPENAQRTTTTTFTDFSGKGGSSSSFFESFQEVNSSEEPYQGGDDPMLPEREPGEEG